MVLIYNPHLVKLPWHGPSLISCLHLSVAMRARSAASSAQVASHLSRSSYLKKKASIVLFRFFYVYFSTYTRIRISSSFPSFSFILYYHFISISSSFPIVSSSFSIVVNDEINMQYTEYTVGSFFL